MKGLLVLAGKPGGMSKGMSSGKPMMGPKDPKASYASEIFSALKDDDEEGFAAALESYVKACVGKSAPEEEEDEGYDDEEMEE